MTTSSVTEVNYRPGTKDISRYILDLFKDYSDNRAMQCEPDWHDAHDLFNGIDISTVFKKGEAGNTIPTRHGVERTTSFGKTDNQQDWRSKDVVLLAKNKTVIACAIIKSMLLKNGDLPFALPVDPEYAKMEGVDKAAEAMHRKIKGQFRDTRADRSFAKCIDSMGMYGMGWIHGPFIVSKSKSISVIETQIPPDSDPKNIENVDQYSRWQRSVKVIKLPSIRYVSVWNMFWDLEVDDPHLGQAIFERQLISPYDLRRMVANGQNFDEEMIDIVLLQSKDSRSNYIGDTESLPPSQRNITNRKKNIRLLHMQGRIPVYLFKEYKDARGHEELSSQLEYNPDAIDEAGREVEVDAYIANEHIIKLDVNVFGTRTYWMCPWERKLDESIGQGIVNNVKYSQISLTGCVRAALDNAKLSGDVIIAEVADAVDETAGGDKMIIPGKRLQLAPHITNVQEAMQQFTVQNTGEVYLGMIPIIERYADANANLPAILTGQDAGAAAGQGTAFEAGIKKESSGQYLGSVITNIDEELIEPLVEAYYNINMLEPGQKPEQGPFLVNATGFDTFQNKVLRQQQVMTLLDLVAKTPQLASRIKMEKILEEIVEALDSQPDEFIKTDKEIEQEESKQQQLMIVKLAKLLGVDPEVMIKAAQTGDGKDLIEAVRKPTPVEQSQMQLNAAKAEGALAEGERDKASKVLTMVRAQNEAVSGMVPGAAKTQNEQPM